MNYGSYMAAEIYVNGEFAGHRGLVTIIDEKLYVDNAERIAEQWTPLATQYQMESVHQQHPLDASDHSSRMVACQRTYKLHLRRLDRLSTERLPPSGAFHIASLDYTVRLIAHGRHSISPCRAIFEMLLGWTISEEIGQVVCNTAALKRVNFTP